MAFPLRPVSVYNQEHKPFLWGAAAMYGDHCPLILFILKKFHHYGTPGQTSNGMWNSAQFVVDMLLAEGRRAKLVEADDSNSIDRIVTQNQPAVVVLEALWVTPDKMAQLIKLHPQVKWTVRVHSELPFLANEGCAIAWLAAFVKLGVEIAFNSFLTANDFAAVMGPARYLPNYYPLRKPRAKKPISQTLDVGCFGAIRPLKNQLVQAFAAIQYARMHKKTLVFHMNGSRTEQQGDNNLKNLLALFAATGCKLEMHPWMGHDAFLEVLSGMDICLQVSLSESFCITAVDAVSMGVPLVGSTAIPWLPGLAQADVNSAESVVQAMQRAGIVTLELCRHNLMQYLRAAQKTWNDWIAQKG